MMRIHFLITDLEIGGTPRVVKELAIRVRPFGFETSVACLSPWGPVADELAAAGVPVTAFNARSVSDLRRTIRCARAWAASADVLFSFLMHANVVATLARRRSTRLIQSVQTTQPNPAWHWWLQGLVNRSAECVVVPSPSVVEANATVMPPRRVCVIPNAVDLPADTRRPPRADGPWRVGFIGRLDPVKCVPTLVRAAALLPDVELHVYGEGPARSDIEAAADDTHLGHRLIMHGRVASSAEALAHVDTLVLPSAAEGFGLVIIEAMAAGMPVIATRVPGIVYVVRDGETGLLVPPHDAQALAAAIDSVQRNAALRESLTRAAFDDVRDRFTWDSVLPAYIELLNADDRLLTPLPLWPGEG